MEYSVIVWILCGILGAVIGANKNRVVLGATLGVLLGLIGIIIICCVKTKEKQA